MTGFAFYPSPFGIIRVDYEEEVLTRLRVVEREEGQSMPTALTEGVFGQLQEYFAGKRREFDVPFALHGTEFQKKVWTALRNIPYGHTASYGDIARAVESPKAVRAVGAANGKNPMWIIIPCHRVVGSDGALTGYAGGVEMKQALLELERRTLSE